MNSNLSLKSRCLLVHFTKDTVGKCFSQYLDEPHILTITTVLQLWSSAHLEIYSQEAQESSCLKPQLLLFTLNCFPFLNTNFFFLQRRENAKARTSMREKLVEKQKATDEHESNFTAGRVNVRERYLHRTGIRGRKSWIFYAVLYILALLVIVNIVVSVHRFENQMIVFYWYKRDRYARDIKNLKISIT